MYRNFTPPPTPTPLPPMSLTLRPRTLQVLQSGTRPNFSGNLVSGRPPHAPKQQLDSGSRNRIFLFFLRSERMVLSQNGQSRGLDEGFGLQKILRVAPQLFLLGPWGHCCTLVSQREVFVCEVPLPSEKIQAYFLKG